MGWFSRWLDNRKYKKEFLRHPNIIGDQSNTSIKVITEKELKKQREKLRDHSRHYFPKRTKGKEFNTYKSRLLSDETEKSAESDLEHKK